MLIVAIAISRLVRRGFWLRQRAEGVPFFMTIEKGEKASVGIIVDTHAPGGRRSMVRLMGGRMVNFRASRVQPVQASHRLPTPLG